MSECPPGVHSMFDFCPGDCMKPVSAREELIRSVYSKLSQNQMEELVDDFAHELAEQIRNKCSDLYGSPNALRPGIWADEGYGLLDAADLIDPKVEPGTQQSGCACDGQTLLAVHTEGRCYNTSKVLEGEK